MSTPEHPQHLTLATIDRLLLGELPAEETKSVVDHVVLGRCDICRVAIVGRLYPPLAQRRPDRLSPSQPRGSPLYDRAFRSSSRRTLRHEEELAMARLQATHLWAELQWRPHVQRLRLIAEDPRFQEWSLYDRLLELSRECPWYEPELRVELAELAFAVAGALDDAGYPPGLTADFRAAALANLAHARRLAGDLGGAERAFKQAWRWRKKGTGDALEKANLLHLEAGLRLELGDCEGALRPLQSAATIYHRYGDRPREGRVVLQMARAWGYQEPRRGVALAREALELIDGACEPRLELSARHALIWFLNDSGESLQALEMLDAARPLYRQIEGSQPRLYQKWLEARISRGLGDLSGAEQTLKAVWRDFRDAGFNQDLTLVSLDLAEVFLAHGRARRAVLLLRCFEPTLRLFKMHSYGMAAWLLLREALASELPEQLERVQPLLREAALYFRRAWSRPLPFPRPVRPLRKPR